MHLLPHKGALALICRDMIKEGINVLSDKSANVGTQYNQFEGDEDGDENGDKDGDEDDDEKDDDGYEGVDGEVGGEVGEKVGEEFAQVFPEVFGEESDEEQDEETMLGRIIEKLEFYRGLVNKIVLR